MMITDGGYVDTNDRPIRFGMIPEGAPTQEFQEDEVEFIVEGERLLAHRGTLAKQCVFFSNMFRPAFRESIAKVIELKNVSLRSMRLFLQLTSGEMDNFTALSGDVVTILELFRLVDMFQHTPLIWAVARILQESITPTNCCDVLRFTEHYTQTDAMYNSIGSCTMYDGPCTMYTDVYTDPCIGGVHDYTMYSAARRALSLAAGNFCEIRQSISTLPLSLAHTILSRDDVNVNSELEVLDTAITWYEVHHDPQIFSAVRFEVIPVTDLLKYKSRSKVWAAMRDYVTQQCSLGQRDNLRKLYVIGGIDEAGVDVFDIRKKDWSRGAKLPEPRHAACVVTFKCAIYIIGGCVRGKHSSSALKFTIKENKWMKVNFMTQPRSGAGADVLNGKVFVCGGRNETRVFDSCEYLDVETSKWHAAAPMNTPRAYHGIAATSDALYVVGGSSALNDSSQLATVERYCGVNGIWSYISPVGLPMMAPGCCAVGDRIYLFGGRNLSHSVMSYSFDTDSYSIERPMAVPRGQGVQTVSVGQYIYCMGGCPGFGTLRSMERYDTTTKTWSPLPSKGFAQRSTCFAVL